MGKLDTNRPMSQDAGMKKKMAAIMETDWQNSDIYKELNAFNNYGGDGGDNGRGVNDFSSAIQDDGGQSFLD